MVIIDFADGRDWCKANWVFRWLLADISRACEVDDDEAAVLKNAVRFGHLDMNSLDDRMATRMIAILQQTVDGVLAGRLQGHQQQAGFDENGERMYLLSVRELGALLEK